MKTALLWISAFRLRTLPLAASSTLCGSALALREGHFNGPVFWLTLSTTLLLQLNSNLANDLGDYQNGADAEGRSGPQRAVQSGNIAVNAMRRAIIVFSSLSFACGVWLLAVAPISLVSAISLFIIGLLAIYASIRYTAGKNPYGYRGLGDVSVAFFFGLVGVGGAYYLQAGTIHFTVLLPALVIGFLSAGVLNLNNLRDREHDAQVGKKTLAVRFGHRAAVAYHSTLMLSAVLLMLGFAYIEHFSGVEWLFALAIPLPIVNMAQAGRHNNKQLDSLLKPLALGTFALSVLLFGGIFLANTP